MTKKKRLGIKAKIRAEKEKERRLATAIFLAIILLAAVFSVYFGCIIANPSPSLSVTGPTLQSIPKNLNPESTVAIVDQVSLTSPDQTFVQTTTEILNQANYSVDYYSSEKVTVDFYRNLPTHGYRIIVLRVHSTATGREGTQTVDTPVVLFTSELYSSTKYVSEQLAEQLFQVGFGAESQRYFAISPIFVASTMKGTFQNTLVIMMGCEGLTRTLMAQAFWERGAVAYISWGGSVSAGHTDQATTRLLQHLVTDGQTIKQAVENTVKEVGPDPDCGSMKYYPFESGDLAIQKSGDWTIQN
jgi:hypothetical protein